jgi:hypothetical protein
MPAAVPCGYSAWWAPELPACTPKVGGEHEKVAKNATANVRVSKTIENSAIMR